MWHMYKYVLKHPFRQLDNYNIFTRTIFHATLSSDICRGGHKIDRNLKDLEIDSGVPTQRTCVELRCTV